MASYKVVLTEFAFEGLDSLDHALQKIAYLRFKKLEQYPESGDSCGNKMGYDLTGYRKLYFGNKKFRIVYRIEKDRNIVKIVGIGKREQGEIYRMVCSRIRKKQA